MVDELIANWEAEFDQSSTHLIVANSHLHGDHYAAWNQFVDRENTTMVGLTHEEVMHYWGFSNYPEERLEFDLGGRKFVITGTPGHQSSEIAFYDEWTDLLYTGDMFYRGRLYLEDWDAWAASIKRLRAMADDYPVSHLINNHIEMTKRRWSIIPLAPLGSPASHPCRCPLRCLMKR